MSILQNAIDSIELGIEDYESKDPKRLLSSVRNIYAGILLLFKHKLAILSADADEALIKQKVLPVLEDGKTVWKGKGKKTVDFHQIRERLDSLGISVDWARLEVIQKHRNNIEHYYASVKPETIRQYISDCFLIIRDFIVEHLGSDPRVVLGDATWNCLLNEHEVHAAERKLCLEQIEALEWLSSTAISWLNSALCNECGSDLLRPKGKSDRDSTQSIECSICGMEWDIEDLLELTGSPHDTFRSRKDGDGPHTGECPNCGRQGYDDIDQECAICGEKGPYICIRCGTEIIVEELSWDNSNLCGYCTHVSSKDD
tara:strand:+ start:317 stop:1258 length:942 start_codon:yes stop_codon:yes gene_type:complete